MTDIFIDQVLQTLVPCFKIILSTPFTLLTTVSAGLFQDTVRYCKIEQSMINSLAIASVLFLFSLIHTVKDRFNRKLFNCDFMFSLGLPISFIIGLLYSVTEQRNILEQTLFKIIITYLLGKTINKLCNLFNRSHDGCCPICLEQLHKQIIETKCNHTFHQHCLWTWIQTKKICPLCSTNL